VFPALVRRLSRPPDLVVGPKRWPALFTHAALLELEELTGLDVLNGGLNLLNPRALELRDALYVLLKHAGAGCGRDEAAKLCGLSRIPALKGAVIAAWRASTPDPEPRAEEPAEAKGRPKQTWLDAWAIAKRRLGLSGEEWLAMTPRMAHALLADYMEELRQGELMQSKIAAAVVNFGGMGRPETLVKDEAFMIHPWPKQASTEGGVVTGEELMQVFAPLRAEQEKRK
jgi:hypothetical protein